MMKWSSSRFFDSNIINACLKYIYNVYKIYFSIKIFTKCMIHTEIILIFFDFAHFVFSNNVFTMLLLCSHNVGHIFEPTKCR